MSDIRACSQCRGSGGKADLEQGFWLSCDACKGEGFFWTPELPNDVEAQPATRTVIDDPPW